MRGVSLTEAWFLCSTWRQRGTVGKNMSAADRDLVENQLTEEYDCMNKVCYSYSGY